MIRMDVKISGIILTEKVIYLDCIVRKSIKLLGTTITNDLKWNENTKSIVKSSNKRMQLLHRAAKFTNNMKNGIANQLNSNS